MPTEQEVLDALRGVVDPDFGQDVVALGFVKQLKIVGGDVSFELELTSPTCAIRDEFKSQAERLVRRVPGVARVRVVLTARADAPGSGPGSACPHSAGPTPLPAVTVTARALEALRDREWADGDFMRIGISAGGCSGHTYTAAVDDELFVADLILYENAGLRIVADPDSAAFLDGLEIDYSDDLVRSGFRFSNPNAGGACGCGASFKA